MPKPAPNTAGSIFKPMDVTPIPPRANTYSYRPAGGSAGQPAIERPLLQPFEYLLKPSNPSIVYVEAHHFITANRGIELLASSVDVEAIDAEAATVAIKPLIDKPSGELFNVAAFQQMSAWTPGYNVEQGLDQNEQALLNSILSKNSDNPTDTLIKKMFANGKAACFQADRLYSHAQRAYTHDIPSLKQALAEQTVRAKAAEAYASQSQSQIVEQQSKELVELRKYKEQMKSVFKQLKEVFKCSICTEVAILPKVLGTCGHITCQNCLKQLDDVAFATLTSSGAGASARQHLLARRCPLCRAEIIGGAFPVLPLKDAVTTLIANNCIEVDDHANVQKHIRFKAINFEKETPEQKHIAALQLGCYAQSQLAQHSVAEVITKITPDQWRNGVYVLFESAVSRVFFETFATTLHGRAGGVNVLVNAAQRMLAVQLGKKKDEGNHLIINVATDGRFIIKTDMPNIAVANPKP